jgi:hypothetical protein
MRLTGRAASSRHDAAPKPTWTVIEIATILRMLAFSHQTGVTLAEVGFLLILFAGVWLVAAQIPVFKIPRARTIVAGMALALAGVLLIIATHWGHFG